MTYIAQDAVFLLELALSEVEAQTVLYAPDSFHRRLADQGKTATDRALDRATELI